MVAPRTTATETQRPQTPLCDKRVYKHAQLDSGVRILVVQDVAAVYAAACASVQVGYFDDPQDLSGAAHFLEHMVHLGSKHFPDDKEYKHFLAQHGGSSNASTSMVHTKYHFKVHNTALEGALQRFISMLSCPLILASSCAGEVQNVHAEYSRNLNSDGRKLLQLRRSLCRPPYSNFSTGSLQTLWEQPQQQGIDVPKALQHLWQQCYKAESICVAVVGPQQPDVLLQWVSEAVANIPSSSNSTDSNASSGSCSNGSNAVSCGNAAGIISEHAQQCYSSDRAMQQHEVASVQPSIATSMCMRYPLDVCNSDETSRGQLVLISPQRQLRDLEVSWYIPSGVMEHCSTKPWQWASHLLGHEGPGSVAYLLKSQELLQTLTVGMGEEVRLGRWVSTAKGLLCQPLSTSVASFWPLVHLRPTAYGPRSPSSWVALSTAVRA
eukprot:GHRR01033527.1.p1 GENE.GHRR01033527.1~~GHRR01033527.1.p1  ORF type:complete len:485 (+),score=121.85 GHRR01033527.1:146-1456(+)